MVKVNQEQLMIIEKVLDKFEQDRTRAALHYTHSKQLPQSLFVRCMIEGWEVQRSKEDQVKDLFNNYPKQGVAHKIIRKMCEIMELKIDGIN